MSEKFPNPYGHSSLYGHFWEIMKDQEWRSGGAIQAQLRARGFPHADRFVLGQLGRLKQEGAIPRPPAYPMGAWQVIKRRGLVQLRLNDPVSGQMDEKIVTKLVDESVRAKVDQLIQEGIEKHAEILNAQINELKKSHVPILELHNYQGKTDIISPVEPAHAKMAELLYLLNLGEHVYLFGPAGSGKSSAAFLAAEALGRRYGYISLTPQTFESRLFGFMAADGKTYVRTEFRDCYEKGGLFCIDEMDNGSGNLYTALNGALENNLCAFPDKSIKRHKDFVVVGTGNTSGGGPNPLFPTRRPFDKAFAERFSYVEWSYDERLERAVALSINKEVAPIWHEYCLNLRKYCLQHFPMVLVSPRAVFKGCKYLRDSVLPVEEIMNAIVFKGYDKDSIAKILQANPVPKDKLEIATAMFQKANKDYKPAKKGVRNA